MESRGRINAYVCEKCGHRTITINAVDGTTPFMIGCKALDCGGMAQSSFYRIDQSTRPSHEFYRPDVVELAKASDEVREYVGRGCLLVRRVQVRTLERNGFGSRRA